jgi:predicted amidophosphoribosyltransferase
MSHILDSLLQPDVQVNTRLPLSHRLSFPCLCCGGAVEPGHAYCPACRAEIQQVETRRPKAA